MSIKSWECFMAVAKTVDLPVIGLVTNKSWRNAEYSVGSPSNPATLPYEFCTVSDTKSFFSRLTNVWYSLLDDLHEYLAVAPAVDRIVRRYLPTISEKSTRRPSLIFGNGHPILFPRYLTPNIIEIGGIHVTREDTLLPTNLKGFLEEATDGVILFSLGSMLDGESLPKEVLNAFVAVFARIPQRVLWKLDKSIGNLPENVLTLKWIPQNAVLAHKNVAAFVTHCGISSLYEAIYFAKPLLMVPAYFDQISNAKRMEDFGGGIRLDLLTVNENLLFEALSSLIGDRSYKRRIEELSRLVKDRPIIPQNAVVYWTDYVIRNNQVRHFQTEAVNVTIYQYLLLDVGLFAFLIIIIFALITSSCVKLFSKRNPRNNFKKEK